MWYLRSWYRCLNFHRGRVSLCLGCSPATTNGICRSSAPLFAIARACLSCLGTSAIVNPPVVVRTGHCSWLSPNSKQPIRLHKVKELMKERVENSEQLNLHTSNATSITHTSLTSSHHLQTKFGTSSQEQPSKSLPCRRLCPRPQACPSGHFSACPSPS